jgi:hypothetical protein
MNQFYWGIKHCQSTFQHKWINWYNHHNNTDREHFSIYTKKFLPASTFSLGNHFINLYILGRKAERLGKINHERNLGKMSWKSRKDLKSLWGIVVWHLKNRWVRRGWQGVLHCITIPKKSHLGQGGVLKVVSHWRSPVSLRNGADCVYPQCPPTARVLDSTVALPQQVMSIHLLLDIGAVSNLTLFMDKAAEDICIMIFV